MKPTQDSNIPRTLRETVASPRLTWSSLAVTSQRYSPESFWVTEWMVSVAPSIAARLAYEPRVEGMDKMIEKLNSPLTKEKYKPGSNGDDGVREGDRKKISCFFPLGQSWGSCAGRVCQHSLVNLWLKYTNVTAFPFFFHSIRGLWSLSVLNSHLSTASGRTNSKIYLLISCFCFLWVLVQKYGKCESSLHLLKSVCFT